MRRSAAQAAPHVQKPRPRRRSRTALSTCRTAKRHLKERQRTRIRSYCASAAVRPRSGVARVACAARSRRYAHARSGFSQIQYRRVGREPVVANAEFAAPRVLEAGAHDRSEPAASRHAACARTRSGRKTGGRTRGANAGARRDRSARACVERGLDVEAVGVGCAVSYSDARAQKSSPMRTQPRYVQFRRRGNISPPLAREGRVRERHNSHAGANASAPPAFSLTHPPPPGLGFSSSPLKIRLTQVHSRTGVNGKVPQVEHSRTGVKTKLGLRC